MLVGDEFGVEASTSRGSCDSNRLGVMDGVFCGRNPCRPDQHRRGAAFGWYHSFLEGVVATLCPLPSMCRGKP
jgi:hypothetical protein